MDMANMPPKTSSLLPDNFLAEMDKINSQQLNNLDARHRRFLIDPHQLGLTRDRISRIDAIRDTDWIFELMAEYYGGWKFLAASGAVDWPVVQARIRSDILSAGDPLETSRFREILAQAFARVPDGHLGLIQNSLTTNGLTSDNCFFYRSGIPRVWQLNPDTTVDAKKLGYNVLSLKRVAGNNQVTPVSCIIAESPQSFRNLLVSDEPLDDSSMPRMTSVNTNLPVFKKGDRWSYVRISVCSWGKETTDKLFASAAQAFDSEYVIVDLRGNNGGDEAVFGRWLELLGAASVCYEHGVKTCSSAVAQSDLNADVLKIATQSFQKKDAVENCGHYIGDYRKAVDEMLESVQQMPASREARPWDMGRTSAPNEKRFRGRLIVLIDRDTKSAGESSARMARQLPGSVIIGTNTGGMRVVSCNNVCLLPYSRLMFRCGYVWTTSLLDDPMFREGLGVLPDIFWRVPPCDLNSLVENVLAIVRAAT